MSLRKAQKHMQRATELLDQSQLEFGTGDNKPGVETREMKRKIEELEKQKEKKKKDQKGASEVSSVLRFKGFVICIPYTTLY